MPFGQRIVASHHTAYVLPDNHSLPACHNWIQISEQLLVESLLETYSDNQSALAREDSGVSLGCLRDLELT
jgi:hypothetical protein